jgi:RNA polymerase sigma factor (sigma-70 family)
MSRGARCRRKADMSEAHARHFGSRPPLLRSEEAELAQRAARGDLRAGRRIVEAHLGLVTAIARGYRGRGVDFEDLLQEGTLGLIRALAKFDAGKGFRFATYASWWVRQGVQRAIMDQGRTIRIPASAADKLRRINRAERRLCGTLGRRPHSEELARAAGLSAEDVAELRLAAQEPSSLDAATQGGTLRGEPFAEGVDQDADRRVNWELMVHTLESAVARLPDPRQKTVLELHYGLGDEQPKTLREIGDVLGLTAARISQLESNALAALRSAPAAEAWRDALAA